jgi:hypothetical protein
VSAATAEGSLDADGDLDGEGLGDELDGDMEGEMGGMEGPEGEGVMGADDMSEMPSDGMPGMDDMEAMAGSIEPMDEMPGTEGGGEMEPMGMGGMEPMGGGESEGGEGEGGGGGPPKPPSPPKAEKKEEKKDEGPAEDNDITSPSHKDYDSKTAAEKDGDGKKMRETPKFSTQDYDGASKEAKTARPSGGK